MKRIMLLTAVLAVAAGFFTPVLNAQTCKPVSKKHKVKPGEVPCQDLRDQLNKLQAEFDEFKNHQTAPAPAVAVAPETDPVALPVAQSAKATADEAKATADAASATAKTAQSTVTGLAETVVNTQKKLEDEINEPSAIHYKGITITPVAFAAFEGVYRQHSVNSDINTPFNNIPFPSASEGHVSELNFSGRQSRLGALFQGTMPNSTKISGYFEVDFLGAGTTSNNNQSNSYVLRQRQIWGQAAFKNGFTVTGGQMWSLVTEDRKGTDNRTEILPQTIDPQYTVGYSWTRQPGFRVQQRFGDTSKQAFTIAASVEQAQITGFNVNSTVAAAIPTQYFFGGIGQNGGLYNAAAANGGTSNITTYANNVVPDVIVKAAYDLPKFHAEVGGLGRFLRDYYLPITATSGTAAAPVYTYSTLYSQNTKTAGGVFGSARVYLDNKKIEVAAAAMAGTGVGRYGSSQLADATLRPDETLAPVKNYHGLFSIETHPNSKFDVFAYYGGEYAQRTTYTTSLGDVIGYGARNLNDSGCYSNPAAPSTTVGAGNGGGLGATACASPTRYIQEAVGGFIWKPINSPKYGRVQYWLTYSYLQRNLWSGASTNLTNDPTGPRATEPMVHVSMRYYIP